MVRPLPADLDGFRRWQFGRIRVTSVMEIAPTAADPSIFIQAERNEILEHRDWLVPSFATPDGDIILHFQAFIIEADGKRIVVDPCIGNDKPRAHELMDMLDNPFLERLALAGFPRESIDYVLCTHLHVDHVGWNTMLVDGEWAPTFPNARYLFAKDEVACAAAIEGEEPEAVFADSVKPVLDAGLADLVEPDCDIIDGVRLVHTPGHTAAHCSIVLSSEGRDAIITGDVIHHPFQAAMPERSSNFCWDEQIGSSTRRRILSSAAETGTPLLVAHFAGTSCVVVRHSEDGGGFRVDEI